MIQKQMLDTIKPILENNYCPNWKEVSKEIEKIMDDEFGTLFEVYNIKY